MDLIVVKDGDMMYINGNLIVKGDVMASNGVIYVMGDVLVLLLGDIIKVVIMLLGFIMLVKLVM